MRPLSALSAGEAATLHGVLFDLDDTILDHGVLTEIAYAALFRLRASGLRLVACTGRPAGWGEVLARQWPIDAIITENGAMAIIAGARVSANDALGRTERRARRALLLDLAVELIERFPETALADDNDARVTDVTLDIGEHRRVPAACITAMQRIAGERGVRTLTSSVHLHLTTEPDDKASGAIRLLCGSFGEDATAARARWAYVGDSGNDAAAFAAFALTFGVANVCYHLRALSVPPRYVADEPMGRGFAAVASRIVVLRG